MKIATKINLVLFLIILAFGLFLGFYIVKISGESLNTELTERTKALVDNLAFNSEYPLRIRDKESLANLGNGILKQKDIIFCRIDDKNGSILFQSGLDQQENTTKFISPIFTERKIGRKEEIILGTTTTAKEEIGKVYLTVSLVSLNRKLGDVKLAIVIILIVTLFAVFLAASLLIRIILSRPIHQLTIGTEKIAAGVLNYEIPIKSQDEMGNLAMSFNKMAQDLQRTTTSIDNLNKEVAERKRAEEQYRMILLTAIDSFWIVDMQGRFLNVNDAYCRLVGYSRAELLKMHISDVEAAENPEETAKHIQKIIQVGGDRFETLHRCKDGRIINVEISVNYSKEEGGRLFVFLRDITEHKKAEQEKLQSHLAQASKMSAIGTLAGGIAHDFNNLLFVIQGNTEVLKSELPESAKELHILVDNIKTTVTRGTELSKKLLVFARKEQYRLEPTNINRVMKEVISLLERTIEKMIDIKTYLEPDLGVVMADASQIHQAVLNLCINAKDAMSHSGTITIETSNVVIDEHYVNTHLDAHPGRFVMISISDTGIGMDKETCAHLFEPFFTTKERGKGVGLGLPVTYGIVKAHNGFINVYSEKGKGTCFKIYLPVSGEKVVDKPIVKDEEIFEKGTGTILLTDDEVQIQDLGKRILERYGYQVIVANNGKEALEIYQQRKDEIIIVILDFIMPGWSGKETFEELRKINPDIKVLIATGYSLNSHGEELIQEGVKGFIQKPFTMKELLKSIKEILAN